MRVHLKKRSGKPLDSWDVPDHCTYEEFRARFYKEHHFYPERQRWTIGDAKGPALEEGQLCDIGVTDGCTLIFKDLGVQISWRLVFVLEYLGPILIFPTFYYGTSFFYAVGTPPEKNIVQKLGLWLTIFHYLKREFETLFVHRFSNVTMPIYRVPLNCGHYWVLFGVFVAYFLFHPRYSSPWVGGNEYIVYILSGLMVLFEALNFRTHLILRSLRPRGTKARGIPQRCGFSLVSCANYFWEILSWLMFCIMVNCLTGWVFLIVASVQMTDWALKKHRNYKKQFDDYPTSRRAILPFIL